MLQFVLFTGPSLYLIVLEKENLQEHNKVLRGGGWVSLLLQLEEGKGYACDWHCGFTRRHLSVAVSRGEAVCQVQAQKKTEAVLPLARPAAWTQENQPYSRPTRVSSRLCENISSLPRKSSVA